MKKKLSNFLVILSSLLIIGCGRKAQPTISPTITLKPIETIAPITTIKPTATFLPTFTPAQSLLSPFPTQTLTSLPKDIFDNFQGLSGKCKVKTTGKVTLNGEEILDIYHANVSINFDRKEYSPGNPIKLSASLTENYYDESKHVHGIVVKVIVEEPALERYSFYLYDDGTHGDEKADDGVYANAFDHTLNTGIYKFYFQLTNHSKNTGEIFTRECFLAKTVKTAPVTTEHGSCKRIEASAPVIVRAEDVGGSNSSELGKYALNPKALSIGTGILATWFTGFDGQAPKPNAYMRLLDFNVNPIGDVNLLFERNRTGQSYSLVKKDDFAILTYCGRYKVGGYYEDRTTSAFLDSYGRLISEQVRSPTNRGCNNAGGEVIWTGSHMMFAWTSITSSYFNPELLLDVADTNGNSISWKLVRLGASENPRLAVGHRRALMVVTTRTGVLAVHRFDLEGNEAGEPVVLSPVTYEINGEIVVGKFETPYIVPTTNGWMVLAALKPLGIYVAHLTPEGMLVSEPFITNNDLYFTNGFNDVLSYKDGAAILDDDKILFLSGNGIVNQQWYTEQDAPPSSGSFFTHQGRLYLIYTKHLKEWANQVLVRELQCVP